MFVIVNMSKTVSYTIYICIYDLPPYEILCVSNGSLVIAVKPKAKCRFRSPTILPYSL